MKDASVCVVGAGLAGSMVANLLGKLGYRVDLYERRNDPRNDTSAVDSEFGASASATKRSINLALSQRGMKALEELGVLDAAMESAIRMPCRIIHSIDGSTARQNYGLPSEAIWSVGRQTLNELLLEVASRPGSRVRLHFGYTLLSVDKAGHCVFNTPQDEILERDFDLVIGADGAFSAVRDSILRLGRVNFDRRFIGHGYKELCIPPVLDKNHQLTYALPDHEGLHIWPRGEFMLIALPNPDKSFTATLFAPYHGRFGFDAVDIDQPDTIKEYFATHFPDALHLMPDIVTDFVNNPVGSLVTLKVNPWLNGKVLLLGDAAHAVVPFFGQGMNAAFEDGYLLYHAIKNAKGDLMQAAAQFAKDRIPATDALADLCVEHYHDMASNTASLSYRIMKRIEISLNYWFPDYFKPLYTMVSFTTIPYHTAVARAHAQDLWLGRICSLFGIAALTGIAALGMKYSNFQLPRLTK